MFHYLNTTIQYTMAILRGYSNLGLWRGGGKLFQNKEVAAKKACFSAPTAKEEGS